MKGSLLSLFVVALLIVGVSACAPKPAAQFAPALESPKTDMAVQAAEVTKPAAAPTPNLDTAAEGNVRPVDALTLIMLQWLVAR